MSKKPLHALRHGCLCAAALLGLAVSGASWAQSTVLSTPWYVGAGLGGSLPESLRDLEPGPQGRLLVGIPLRPQAFVEASVFGMQLSGKSGLPDEKTLGGGLDLKLESLGERFNFLFIAGGGYSQARRGGSKINAPYANIGWGVELDFDNSFSLRTELRGLARFENDFADGRGVTYDGLLTVGLVKRFGATPPAAPRVAPPPPVAPPPLESAPPALPPPPSGPDLEMPLVPLDLTRCAPAPAGVGTEADGCLGPQRTVLPRTRLFAGESARLADNADDLLVPLVISLLRQPSLKTEIVVHTDTLGLQSTNLDLTLKMADQIRDRLRRYGVPASQMEVLGAGETEPRHNEIDDAAREKNRRIELNLSR